MKIQNENVYESIENIQLQYFFGHEIVNSYSQSD